MPGAWAAYCVIYRGWPCNGGLLGGWVYTVHDIKKYLVQIYGRVTAGRLQRLGCIWCRYYYCGLCVYGVQVCVGGVTVVVQVQQLVN